jgi:meso-butanediol dehydrogenase/(S,S)-butanediol dehydrogenase/diacetyl reductase
MLRSLEGEVALVTGASRGIGRAVANRLAKQGADVVITGRTESDLREVEKEILSSGRKALVAVGDATNEMDVRSAVEGAVNKFGRIDILVNNVGIGAYKSFTSTSVSEYDQMVAENLKSTFLFTRFVIPVMVKQHYGQIITISSQSGKQGYAGEALYVGTKFFQMGMMESLDRELLEQNIKVSVVCPGSVNTYFALGAGRQKGDPALQQYLSPEEVAESVNFVAAQPWKSYIMEIDLRPVNEARY